LSLTPRRTRSNENRNRVKARYRALWRRTHWSLLTADRYRQFDTLQDALDHVRRLQQPRHATGPLQVRIEERDPAGSWREIPESGWIK